MAGFPILLQRAAIGVEMRGVAENALPRRAARASISTRLTLVFRAAATRNGDCRRDFLALKVRLRSGHLVCRAGWLRAGSDRRHGQPEGHRGSGVDRCCR